MQVGDDFYSTRFYTRAHDRVHRAGPRRGQAVLRVSRRTRRRTGRCRRRTSRSRVSRAATTRATRRSTRAASRARRSSASCARTPSPSTTRASDPRWNELSGRGAALRGAPHGDLRGDGQRPRHVRRARSSSTSSASASSTTPSSCSCPTTAPSRRAAISCAPISEHVGKEYDHSLDNLGSASSYVMYGANWAERQRDAVLPPQGARRSKAASSVPAFVQLSAHDRRAAAAATASARSWISCRRSSRSPAPSIPARRFAACPSCRSEGASLLPMLTGEADEVHRRRTRCSAGSCSVNAAFAKAIGRSSGISAAARQRRWQLFDLAADPFEQHDLSASNPEQLATMERALGSVRRARTASSTDASRCCCWRARLVAGGALRLRGSI